MNKTYKKSDIDKYLHNTKKKRSMIKEEKIDELIDTAGTLIDKDDNFRTNTTLIRSKKTSDDFIRSATQGPEAYFIYGGPYYGINYSYTVSEGEILEEDAVEENISPELHQDLEAFHGEEDDILHPSPTAPSERNKPPLRPSKFRPHKPSVKIHPRIVDESQIDEMKSLVDEIIRNKKDNRGMVKKSNETGVMGDIDVVIPDISELKQVHEKPMVIRKMDNFLDLVHKEGLTGEELAIVINHIINNVELDGIK